MVDDDAWAKVKEGVYKGLSIGGRVTARDAINKALITGVELTEISLVDRPANPEALIDPYKAAGVPKIGARNSAPPIFERIQPSTILRSRSARTAPAIPTTKTTTRMTMPTIRTTTPIRMMTPMTMKPMAKTATR